jgi:hypothetical protein
MAQGVGPEFKPQYCKTTKNQYCQKIIIICHLPGVFLRKKEPLMIKLGQQSVNWDCYTN